MMTPPSVAEISGFSGRPVASYPAFTTMALAQATLMLKTLTKLTDYPVDPDLAQLAKFAIMEMADRIVLEQPYSVIKSSPFQTETIGSYSYSKTSPTTKTALQGSRTGLYWWDIAIEELTVAGSTPLAHGSIHVLPDGLYLDEDGSFYVMDESEIEGPDRPPYVRIS